MLSLLLITAGLLVAATLLPLSKSRQWYIRALDFPRVQIATLALMWLIIFSQWGAFTGAFATLVAIGVMAALLYQLYWILPNTQLSGVEVERIIPTHNPAAATLKILSYNVLMHNRNADALIALVDLHGPDVLITLESDQWWQDKLDNLHHYPHRIACPLDNLYGMHVYSQLPLHEPAIEYLVENDKPSMHVKVELENQSLVKMHVVHPAPPAPEENNESIERDVELLLIAKSVANRTDPVVVAGDLNDVAWSATTRLFRQISGLKDPRVGRGMFNTFNARHWFVRWPLDHVFVSSHFHLMQLERLPDIGSDHFPLLVELALMQSSIESGSQTQAPSEPELLEQILDTDTAQQARAAHADTVP